VDISHLLATHKTKTFPTRDKPPTTLFIHHSGKQLNRMGIDVASNMARYHVNHKLWPGIAYHYFIPRIPAMDRNGVITVYRVAPENTIRAHTWLCNRFSSGVCVEGHLGKAPPSEFQLECLEALIPWWMEKYGRSPRKSLGWHSNSWKWGGIPKPTCPGKHMTRWLQDYVDLS
jgi:hypothetical protein